MKKILYYGKFQVLWALIIASILIITSCSSAAPAKPVETTTPATTAPPAAAATAKPADSTRDYKETIKHGGLDRSYLVHLPPGFDKSKSLPVVIQLHGGGSNAAQTDKLTKFQTLADKDNFIVVAPDGIGSRWNDGKEGAIYRAATENIDDVGFISALIDRLVTSLNVDPKRVYVAGVSNGGMMTLRLGVQLADKIAAIGSVIGSLANPWFSLTPQRPLPVIMINSTEDPLVPIEGGGVTFLGRVTGQVAAPADVVKYWVEKNGCSAPVVKEDLPDISTTDGSTVTRETYTGCKDNVEVIFYLVKGASHTWPGGPQFDDETRIGKVNRDFDATAVIWEFFKKHPMP